MLGIDHSVGEGQDVDIDRARTPAFDAHALHRPLDLQTSGEQFLWLKQRLNRRAGVVEIGLIRLAPGRRPIKTRHGGDPTVGTLVEAAQSLRHGGHRISDIAAEAKRCRQPGLTV